MGMLLVVRELIQEQASFFLLLVTAMGLRLAVRVRLASIGRLFLIRSATTTTRGTSTSIRETTTRAATAATSGTLCAQFQMFTKQRTNVSAFNSLIL